LVLTVAIAASAGCDTTSLDTSKFDSIKIAVNSIQSDLDTTDGVGSDRFSDDLRQFEAEISTLQRRTLSRREAAVLNSYTSAAEMYRWFSRFKSLATDEVNGMVLLRGPYRVIASRYEFPFENRGGGRWVNRRAAMKRLTDEAEVNLADAERLQAGKKQ
jgi:hypothetical protein